MRLKSLKEQVVVLLGASSGIGRVTAKQFAAAGSRVVVAARSEEGLQSLVEEITSAGGKAAFQVVDTTDLAKVQALAQYAVDAYGTIDTWVQLAGVGVHAEWEQTTTEEFRQTLDINVIGMFHGLRAAVPVLRKQGGAFIGLGSVESDVSFPMQAAYAASKHAVLGLLDGVRVEVLHNKEPVSITTVKPAAIDTPFFERAKSKTGVEFAAPPPVYRPEDVAKTILYAAEHPSRDLYVGGGGRFFAAMNAIAPNVVDKIVAATQWNVQKSDEPKSADAPNGLEGAVPAYDRDYGKAHGRPSVYTWIRTNPKTTLALAAAAVGATAAVVHEIAEHQRVKESFGGRLRDRFDDLRVDLKPYARQVNSAWDQLVNSARDAAKRWG